MQQWADLIQTMKPQRREGSEMSFLICLGAYVTGWILCNVFLFQLADRIDKDRQKRIRSEMCADMANQIAEKLKAGRLL